MSNFLYYVEVFDVIQRRDVNAAVNIKIIALRNYVSGTDTQNRDELPTLVGVLTPDAQPIGSVVGG